MRPALLPIPDWSSSAQTQRRKRKEAEEIARRRRARIAPRRRVGKRSPEVHDLREPGREKCQRLDPVDSLTNMMAKLAIN
mmetsp:Transcript_2078/g.4693  ORF Transcript_2078/g.4693 Transcript_2078/m.4693 type:complete len:80 (+) Transcript_2078:2163-2402(+)